MRIGAAVLPHRACGADVALFLLALVFYAISTLAHVACWIGSTRRSGRFARLTLLVAVVLHGAAILARWIEAGYAPLSNGFEAFSAYAWGLSLAYLLIPSLRRHTVLGAFVTPLAMISILVASVLPKRIVPLVPVLQRNNALEITSALDAMKVRGDDNGV